ncbi:MAG: hypothetical protein V4492_06850 [Chlamydiota bacterium]
MSITDPTRSYGKTHLSEGAVVYDFRSQAPSSKASATEEKTEATASRFWTDLAALGLMMLTSAGVGAAAGAKSGLVVFGLHGAVAGAVLGAIGGLALGIITCAYDAWKDSRTITVRP